MWKIIDLSGRRFGRLTVVHREENGKGREPRWRVRCKCGKEKVVHGRNLRKGRTRSCGCLNAEMSGERWRELFSTHGRSKDGIYRIWQGMKNRCLNPQNKHYKDYGGRGIRVCKRWLKFENFFQDMGEKPKRMTLDRRDNDGNYEPENCRWATRKTQQRNTRATRMIRFNGEVLPLPTWAEKYGINGETLRSRLNRGWPIKKAVTEPVHKK